MKNNSVPDLLIRFALDVCADLEDRFWDPVKPRPPGFWRRLYLRNLQVVWGRHLCTRPDLFILRRGHLTLGDRVCLGHQTRIFNHAPISIGDDFLNAGGLTLNSGSHDPITLTPCCAPITIGKRVWCGERVTILGGVTVGDDVVIGAGSLVLHDIPSGSIAGGSPARVLKPLERSPSQSIWSPIQEQT